MRAAGLCAGKQSSRAPGPTEHFHLRRKFTTQALGKLFGWVGQKLQAGGTFAPETTRAAKAQSERAITKSRWHNLVMVSFVFVGAFIADDLHFRSLRLNDCLS